MTTSPAAAIVVGVDGSLQNMHAVDWATREAVVHAFLSPLLNGVPVGPPVGGANNSIARLAFDGERLHIL